MSAHVRTNLDEMLGRMEAEKSNPIWISRMPTEAVRSRLEALEEGAPLFGIPFAVKDNIDVQGLPTTAACPAFAYEPRESAPIVQKLLDAGALCLGKTNMDQFATGLVGTRSPHGPCANAHNGDFISGGSSSGSALAVALGMASFALGTDTAGSGRVPAAFNGLVGYKPTRGLWSTRGVVPACRSLDCVSVFTRSVKDAVQVSSVATGFDPLDPFSRVEPPNSAAPLSDEFTFGTPSDEALVCDDPEYRALYWAGIKRLEALGGRRIELDVSPFTDAAKLLYQGPWVAERFASVGEWLLAHPGQADSVVEKIILGGQKLLASDAFKAMYRLQELRRETDVCWKQVDVLVLPTAPAVYRIAEVLQNPVELNSRLGTYTNFANLLDLCAVSLPTGTKGNGVPFGISLIAPAFHDQRMLGLGARFLGEQFAFKSDRIQLAVVGAHLRGQPLNGQLKELGAAFVARTETKPIYRLHALRGTVPPKPGMIRDEQAGGAIEVEVYSLSPTAFGTFVEKIPPPLCIGTIDLQDGTRVKGFLCEPAALEGADEITRLGGWRNYLARQNAART